MSLFRSILTLVLVAVGISSCGSKKSNDDTSESPVSPPAPSPTPVNQEEIVATAQAELVSYLKDLTYRSWAVHHESPVSSSTAHRQWVKTYFNRTVATALKADEEVMPVGSALVKEMYDTDRTTLRGQAVMIKVSADRGNESWLYFEGDLPSYAGAAYGAGHSSCASCHRVGTDYVRSSLP